LLAKKRDVEYSNVYFANKFVKQIQSASITSLDSQQFSLQSCYLVEEKISKMTPKQVLGAIELFEDDEMRKKLMHATIKALKELKIDIRAFSVL
jgi:uncharacterized membrane-anchored protein YjiN (DUF445 family)